MTELAQATAKLVFAGANTLLSIDSLTQRTLSAMAAAGETGVHPGDALLTGTRLHCDTYALRIEIAPDDAECIVALRLHSPTLTDTELKIRLAGMLYHLASGLPATHIIWLETTARLPRDAFLATLAPDMDGATPQPTVSNVTPIAPRRVQRDPGSTTPRPDPDSQSHSQTLARMLPAIDTADRPIAVNANAPVGYIRQDAHVAAFETNLRMALLHEPDADELKLLAADMEPVPVEARLSTWAVSLTVATVSLPVAAPVMIYNIARGEDMRVASLAMALAGFFLALDTSGAMAGVVTGF